MCLYPIEVRNKSTGIVQTVKCGKCIECLKSISQEWALRIMLEAKQYAENCCFTLTYDNEHVPDDYQLVRKDIQLFLKSLRKAISPRKIRIFYSGEYGEKKGRPHFHCIVFGWLPNDLVYKFSKSIPYYTSSMLSKLWKRGFVTVGQVTYETAFYCAKYLQKVAGMKKEVKPFCGMSNRPGIGFNAITPDLLEKGCFYYDGKKYPLPRYFQKVLERDADWQSVMKLRLRRSAALNQSLRCDTDTARDNRRKREADFLGEESWRYGKCTDFILVGESY
ncbi:replication initiator protein [Dipodfec virus UOA04_Rod_1056]|nr:replication initiator protein [Dipodfec virus UOA04_Rod_1056]